MITSTLLFLVNLTKPNKTDFKAISDISVTYFLIFNDIETVLIKDGKEINLSKIEKEKALKRLEELGEIKVVENFKAGKYKPI